MKGVTHCYLPSCDRPTWPFENYCGKTHADLGKKMGLPRKLANMLSEEWLCKLILLCTGPPSISTAMAAAIADSKPAVFKDRSMCILPGCTKQKYVDQQSGVIHDYCGKTHSIEGKRRGIRREC